VCLRAWFTWLLLELEETQKAMLAARATLVKARMQRARARRRNRFTRVNVTDNAIFPTATTTPANASTEGDRAPG